MLAKAWWFELFLPRIGLERLAARGRTERLRRMAERFRALAIELGGLMIKVGQFLSSRLDVLPPEITRELEGLQDEVPAVPFDEVAALASAELGLPLESVFAGIDPVPIAAASLGQAHRATLSDEDAAIVGFSRAVVKIQRPGIDDVVDVDLAALRRVGRWLSHVRLVSTRVDMPALVEEFAQTSLEEVDYLHEAANAERFAADVAGDDRVASPDVVWERTTRRVLTLEDVTAIKINDLAALRAAGIDPADVAERFAIVMFDQIFVRGFFHADPHPGNIFVTPRADAGFALTFIDFGMMGEIDPQLREGLRRAIVAVAARDGRRLVEAVKGLGVLLPSADTAELERAMTQVFDRFGGMAVSELARVDPRELRAFAADFGDLVREMPFQLPEDFLLIIRAASLISGVCSALDPDFNVWNAVEPYAARLLREESGGIARSVLSDAGSMVGTTARLPGRIDRVIDRIEDGSFAIDSPRLDRRIAKLERLVRRAVSAILFAGLLVAGVLLLGPVPWLGWTLMALSVVPLSHAVFAGAFSRGP